ncbi:putative NUDIX domain-containing protein [Rosellinia necatrix]|uniref:Putative NUDIX domain-containing protein n=1 Tax=Rosellinia necatrix TaxID=77044 RepID=A0A1W2TGC2_ROSNE|nr:putative NUDIX domain-containing protein [Rosellinia necatrix]
MATFTLESPAISVSLPEGVSKEQILSFPPFNNWLSTLTASLALQRRDPRHPFHADPYALRSVAVRSADLWAGGRAGFVMLRADVRNAAGESLPGAVFLRGPSVGMLVMLVPDDDDDVQVAPPPSSSSLSGPHPHLDPYAEERYAVLTVQPRIPAGSLAFAELPAGMVDDGDGDDDGSGGGGGGGGGGNRGGKFAGAAAREIQEELGIEIPASELVCLSDLAGAADGGEGEGEGEEGEGGGERGGGKGGEEEEGLANAMYPSAGGCDEYVPLYMHERRVPRAALREWRGRLTGLRAHGERITLRLVPMRDLWREGRRDAKALAALALWERLKREGKI